MRTLPFTMGFEMTGIAPLYDETDSDTTTAETDTITEALSRLVAAKLVAKYPKSFKAGYAYCDGHCLEFPSPVFKTTKAADDFYKFVKKQFDAFGVTPQNKLTVCGGNHIHFGIRNKRKIKNILRNFATHYYVPWVFTQPDDTDSCNNTLGDSEMFDLQEECKHPTDGADRLEYLTRNCYNWTRAMYILLTQSKFPNDYFRHLYNDKDRALTLNKPTAKVTTLEFRCVEAPRDYSEWVDQRDFFIAYMKYAMNLPTQPPITFISPDALNEIKAATAVKGFNALCVTLKLDPKRYAKYVRRNLYPRWDKELGRVRT